MRKTNSPNICAVLIQVTRQCMTETESKFFGDFLVLVSESKTFLTQGPK